jgi:hypothetical protein
MRRVCISAPSLVLNWWLALFLVLVPVVEVHAEQTRDADCASARSRMQAAVEAYSLTDLGIVNAVREEFNRVVQQARGVRLRGVGFRTRRESRLSNEALRRMEICNPVGLLSLLPLRFIYGFNRQIDVQYLDGFWCGYRAATGGYFPESVPDTAVDLWIRDRNPRSTATSWAEFRSRIDRVKSHSESVLTRATELVRSIAGQSLTAARKTELRNQWVAMRHELNQLLADWVIELREMLRFADQRILIGFESALGGAPPSGASLTVQMESAFWGLLQAAYWRGECDGRAQGVADRTRGVLSELDSE